MANTDFINLVPLGLTRGVSLQGAYILILREALGARCMAVPVSHAEFLAVRRMMQGKRSETARTLASVMRVFDVTLNCVVIHNNTKGGEYCAELLMAQGSDVRTVSRPVGVGVVLAVEAGVPLQVGANYFNTITGGGIRGDGTMEIRVPVTAMDSDLLKEALNEAVQEDNFEMATALRDELRRREAMSHTSTTTDF
ncbi:MAG: bifunctional nuclease family protein [Bacteroidaceae bacterium]|nr:bifunctional nuclease family protein [Bacteroidaceae bacterium]